MSTPSLAAWQRALLDRLLFARQLPLGQYLAARDQAADPAPIVTCHRHSDRPAHTFDAAGRPVCAACAASDYGIDE